MNSKLFPRFMWADFDPLAHRSERVVIYSTKADQRANRPDLKPIRVRVSIAPPRKKAR